MSDIATLDQLSNGLDTTAKFVRVLASEGITIEQFMRPVNNRVARRNLATYLAAGCPAFNVLAPYGTTTVGPLTEIFDHNAFFRTRPGLEVSSSLSSRIQRVKQSDPTDAADLHGYDVLCNAYDRSIKAELPKVHEVALWHIAKCIEAQLGGKVGPLLTNLFANVFYFGGFAIHVRWHGDVCRVDDEELNFGHKIRGNRVFSRN